VLSRHAHTQTHAHTHARTHTHTHIHTIACLLHHTEAYARVYTQSALLSMGALVISQPASLDDASEYDGMVHFEPQLCTGRTWSNRTLELLGIGSQGEHSGSRAEDALGALFSWQRESHRRFKARFHPAAILRRAGVWSDAPSDAWSDEGLRAARSSGDAPLAPSWGGVATSGSMRSWVARAEHASSRASSPSPPTPPADDYDPRKCATRSSAGHCRDALGGAWNYSRDGDTRCATEAARATEGMPRALPDLLPGVTAAVDVGGATGVYLGGLRDRGVARLVTIEPIDVGPCLLRGVSQLNINIFAQPHEAAYDLTMSIEVAEHMPARLHPRLIAWLVDHTRRWVVFSAAHPGQPGEGHAAESLKSADAWRRDFVSTGRVEYDDERTRTLRRVSRIAILRANLLVFRKL
jgi:hypothetical protein